MVKLVALKNDKSACQFLLSTLEIGGENFLCRLLQDGEVAKENEIAVFSWDRGCPGKYFRTASHVLRNKVDQRLSSAKAFLGIKKSPPENAIREVLADMKRWPKPRKGATLKESKRRGVYLAAW